ncbi:MAG: hypothetical protein QOH85_2111 [Acidobacteriaceae bacterium]|nr:hypothetical protein [Acidobacteriaceae bacterium]
MKARLWFRISAVILLLFAIGHTVGFLSFRPPTAEGQAVFAAMNNVQFSAAGSTFSYGRFYRGFGLSISASQLFFAWLAWLLASMAQRDPESARLIAWAMVGLQVVGFGLSLKYFSVVPALFSVVVALCLGIGALSIRRAAAGASAV